MKSIHHLAAWPFLLLAGCATPAFNIPDSHPASPSAEESPHSMAHPSLGADEDSRRTQALLKEREKQAKAADADANDGQRAPTSGQPNASQIPMPKMDHSQMSMPMSQ